jgi:CopG family transcriptional regulator/antitoxin EndoAI
MSNLRKVIISLPASLLEQTDRIAEEQKKNRSELIREALNLYHEEEKKKRIRTELIRGYEEMSGLNLLLAEEGMGEALIDLEKYEARLL